MAQKPVSVLIVDDSALIRNLVGRIIENADGLELAGKALNGNFALKKLDSISPDVIVLDLEMPQMNGIEFLRERRRRGIKIPVVILSSIAEKGARITMEALTLGASDFILKPSGRQTGELADIADTLVQTVLAYGRQYRRDRDAAPAPAARAPAATAPHRDRDRSAAKRGRTAVPSAPPAGEPSPKPPEALTDKVEIVAIGISTGGPNALRIVLQDIKVDLPVPVVIVQHMPAGFTAEFAVSLDRICPLRVREAKEGDVLRPGQVFVAPGNQHIVVERRRLATTIRLTDDPPLNGHRPSADPLFESVAAVYGGRSMAIIMTGMGKDGARAIGNVYRAGGVTIGQDRDSCVVYGMPRVAAELGFLRMTLPLSKIAETIGSLAQG